MSRRRALVLGAGIEGLAAGLTLRRGGREVCIVDELPRPGGAAAREEFHPGHHAPGVYHEAGCARAELLGGLSLEAHGLRWSEDEPAVFVPSPEGPGILCHRDAAQIGAELSPEARADVEAYGRWREFLARVRPRVRALLDQPPPEIVAPSSRELWRLGMDLLSLRRLGERDLRELMRVAPMSLSDWIGETFANEPLCTALAAPALVGTVLGPRAPGSAGLLLLRECALAREPVGGAAGLAAALLAACQAAGVELELGRAPARIRVEDGAARGVELEDGRFLEAPLVLSARGLGRTLLDWVSPALLPPSCERAAHALRARGALAVLRLALSRPPSFRGREGRAIARVISARSLVELERVADQLKYARPPERTWLDVWVPSLADASLAPSGHAVVSLHVHGVPRALEEDEPGRRRIEALALAELERVAPGVGATIVGRQLLTPRDLERRYGLQGGHLFEGELALDQLWLQRPALQLARYATPIRGLWLGGAASHPGGPFLGGAGRLAALAALAAV